MSSKRPSIPIPEVSATHTIFPSNATSAEFVQAPMGFFLQPLFRPPTDAVNDTGGFGRFSETLLFSHTKTSTKLARSALIGSEPEKTPLQRCGVCGAYVNYLNWGDVTMAYICRLCQNDLPFVANTDSHHSSHQVVEMDIPFDSQGIVKSLPSDARPFIHLFVIKQTLPYDILNSVVEALSQSIEELHDDYHVVLITFSSEEMRLISVGGGGISAAETIRLTRVPSTQYQDHPIFEPLVPLHDVRPFTQVTQRVGACRDELRDALKTLLDEEFLAENDCELDLHSILSALCDWFVGRGSRELLAAGRGTNSNRSVDLQAASVPDAGLSFDINRLWQALLSIDADADATIMDRPVVDTIGSDPLSPLSCDELLSLNTHAGIRIHLFADQFGKCPTTNNTDNLGRIFTRLGVVLQPYLLADLHPSESSLGPWAYLATLTGGDVYRSVLGRYPATATDRLTERISRIFHQFWGSRCELFLRSDAYTSVVSPWYGPGIDDRSLAGCRLVSSLQPTSSLALEFDLIPNPIIPSNVINSDRRYKSSSPSHLSFQLTTTYETLVTEVDGVSTSWSNEIEKHKSQFTRLLTSLVSASQTPEAAAIAAESHSAITPEAAENIERIVEHHFRHIRHRYRPPPTEREPTFSRVVRRLRIITFTLDTTDHLNLLLSGIHPETVLQMLTRRSLHEAERWEQHKLNKDSPLASSRNVGPMMLGKLVDIIRGKSSSSPQNNKKNCQQVSLLRFAQSDEVIRGIIEGIIGVCQQPLEIFVSVVENAVEHRRKEIETSIRSASTSKQLKLKEKAERKASLESYVPRDLEDLEACIGPEAYSDDEKKEDTDDSTFDVKQIDSLLLREAKVARREILREWLKNDNAKTLLRMTFNLLLLLSQPYIRIDERHTVVADELADYFTLILGASPVVFVELLSPTLYSITPEWEIEGSTLTHFFSRQSVLVNGSPFSIVVTPNLISLYLSPTQAAAGDHLHTSGGIDTAVSYAGNRLKDAASLESSGKPMPHDMESQLGMGVFRLLHTLLFRHVQLLPDFSTDPSAFSRLCWLEKHLSITEEKKNSESVSNESIILSRRSAYAMEESNNHDPSKISIVQPTDVLNFSQFVTALGELVLNIPVN